MDKTYHQTSLEMEKQKVSDDYVIGWQGGYLHHPHREEQRSSDAYEAGYQDGLAKKTDNYKNWIGK